MAVSEAPGWVIGSVGMATWQSTRCGLKSYQRRRVAGRSGWAVVHNATNPSPCAATLLGTILCDCAALQHGRSPNLLFQSACSLLRWGDGTVAAQEGAAAITPWQGSQKVVRKGKTDMRV